MSRRRRGRYMGILRGGKVEEAQKVLDYLSGKNKAEYPERRGNRPEMRNVYVRPFTLALAAGAALVQRVNSSRWNSVSTFVQGFTDPVAPTSSFDVPEILAPRAVITYGIPQTSTTYKRSQITGRQYKDRGGTSVSVPFGAGSGTGQDEVMEVFNVIKQRVEAASQTGVTYVPGSNSF